MLISFNGGDLVMPRPAGTLEVTPEPACTAGRHGSSVDAIRAITNDFFHGMPHIEEKIARYMDIDSRSFYSAIRMVSKRCANALTAPSTLCEIASRDVHGISEQQASLLFLPPLERLDRFENLVSLSDLALHVSDSETDGTISITQCILLGSGGYAECRPFLGLLNAAYYRSERAVAKARMVTNCRQASDPPASVRASLHLTFKDGPARAMRRLLLATATVASRGGAPTARRMLAAVIHYRAHRIREWLQRTEGIGFDPVTVEDPLLLLMGRTLDRYARSRRASFAAQARPDRQGLGKQHKRERVTGASPSAGG